ALDGPDRLTIERSDARQAGPDRLISHQDRATPALALTATILGADQVQLVTEDRQEAPVRFRGDLPPGAIDGQGDGFADHARLLGFERKLTWSDLTPARPASQPTAGSRREVGRPTGRLIAGGIE